MARYRPHRQPFREVEAGIGVDTGKCRLDAARAVGGAFAPESHGYWEPAGIENDARGNRGLTVAAVALPKPAGVELTGSVVAAVRAEKACGSSPLVHSIEALRFGAIEGEELIEAELRAMNFSIFSTICMAMFYTNLLRNYESQEVL